jgi:hypothetical protein
MRNMYFYRQIQTKLKNDNISFGNKFEITFRDDVVVGSKTQNQK